MMKNLNEELIYLLKNFGLNEYEAKVYLTLVALGSSKVGAISKESKVPQSKIYQVLESLVGRGLVEYLGGRPKEFKALDPEVVLKNFSEEKERQIEEMRNLFKQMRPRNGIIEGVWTMKGKGLMEFINRLSDMFDRTREYAYVITRDFTCTPRLAESVKNAIKRGVEIMTVTIKDIDERNYPGAKWLQSHGVKIKLFKTKIHPRIIVTDGEEALIRLDLDPTKEERFPFISLWSRNASLVMIFDYYVKNLWNAAEPVDFEKISVQIEEKMKQNTKA
jgi:sugar-specific transcriptional regulator TrmB